MTVEILVVEENSSGRTGFAVGVAGARVGGTNGADRAIELPRSVGVLPSAATFAGNGFGGLPDEIVVLAGAATVATGYVIIHSRSILSNWASFTGGCFRKWV